MMIKLIIYLLFSICIFAQHNPYESLTEQQLQSVLQKELLNMEARGATPEIIFEKFVVEIDVYIKSREAYLRSMVHIVYVADKILAMKMQNGTDEPSDMAMVKKLKNFKTYHEYLAWKKTDEAIEIYENSTHDGILKLVVGNLEQFDDKEQKRYDGLITLLNKDPFFTRFDITDGKTIKTILPHTN